MKLIQEQEDISINLDKKLETSLVERITADFKEWHRKQIVNYMQPQYDKIKESVYLDIYAKNKSNDELVLLPQVYEQRHTLKSNLWKSNYASYDLMFNVQGRDEMAQENASKQKAQLVQKFRDMGLQLELEKSLDHFIDKGEQIAFIGWETRTKQIRRREMVEEPIIDPETGMQIGSESKPQFVFDTKTVYDGPKATTIDPLNFVFDTEKADDWESCPKISRTFATLQQISDDKAFEDHLDKAKLQQLKTLVEDANRDTPMHQPEELEGFKGEHIELLEFWGDIKVNGETIRNYVIVIAGRQKVIRFESNPYLKCPYVMAQFMPDPDTKRGQSPLLVSIPINQVSSNILNSQLRALKFILNPAYLAPSGMFIDGVTALTPGAIIEYNPSTNSDKPPQPIPFKDALVGFDFLTFFETKIESATGVFKYMVGAQDARSRTATETGALVTGQNTRLSMMIAFLNMKFLIPLIEQVAELASNFTIGPETIKTMNPTGMPEFMQVDESVRQGDYDYVYGDNQSVVESEAKMKKIADILGMFADRININWEEFAKLTLSKLNIEYAETLLQSDPIDVALSGLQPQAKNAIKELLAGEIPAIMQAMTATNQFGMSGNTTGAQGAVQPRPIGMGTPRTDSSVQPAPPTQNFPGAPPVY